MLGNGIFIGNTSAVSLFF